MKIPITVLIAVKNEALNLPGCLSALKPAERVILIDSQSSDNTLAIAKKYGAELIQFDYKGGYPKKRQWALENIRINTPWVFLLDADETITNELWSEIREVANDKHSDVSAFMIKKSFHFLGKYMRFGGFSHSAVLLFQVGSGRFERLIDDNTNGLDMEIHERVLVNGPIKMLKNPVIHKDFKNLEAYLSRHNKYSTWEAQLRHNYFKTGIYGHETIKAKYFGNSQERRRAIKALIIRIPCEPWLWFFYHYFIRLGFLDGVYGLIACQIRASYIAQVRAKIFEIDLLEKSNYNNNHTKD